MVFAVKRIFILKCSQCGKEEELPYNENSSTQKIMRYPRTGNCSQCGETMFNACITATVTKHNRTPDCGGCNAGKIRPWKRMGCPLCQPQKYTIRKVQ